MIPAAVRAVYSRDRYVAMAAAIEVAEEGVCVTDRDGGLRYQNATLQRLLGAEPERRVVEETIADAQRAALARSAAAPDGDDRAADGSGVVGTVVGTSRVKQGPALTLQVRTSGMEYRVRATAVHDDRGDEDVVVVWVRRCRPQQLPPQALRERYRLTPRELRVATLLAARLGSQEIAQALCISPHTARRHAEAVLRKLGVHSRADVRERLRG